jgi:hypothetical protein
VPFPIGKAFLRGLRHRHPPAWALRDRSLSLRTSDKIFLVATARVAGLGRDRSGRYVAAMAGRTPKLTARRQARWIYAS